MANNKDCDFRTSIGGQALIEGILMRGPKKQAIVCRTAEGLVEKVDELKLLKDKYPIFGWPFIRGCVTFIDSMIKGMQALTYSAELVPVEDQEPDKLDQWIEKHFEAEKASKIVIGTAVVLGIALALFLFIFLPTLIVGLIKPLTQNLVIRNLSEGVVKIIILLCYMRLCSCVSDVKRLFSYHGAEHKTIFCYEHGKPLTVENVRTESRADVAVDHYDDHRDRGGQQRQRQRERTAVAAAEGKDQRREYAEDYCRRHAGEEREKRYCRGKQAVKHRLSLRLCISQGYCLCSRRRILKIRSGKRPARRECAPATAARLRAL